ncbi:hypothetical protein [Paraburkholderia diazotrophica]|uniref:Uncharacterized protein n=1 Tax=Paraburkholderia diazotrophica TaxID=667676 RepID=A0A1H7DT01_9BURK|nr:hypothetical protein [Paraburkholderia diazotrophica]SEK02430.1 hypothetical protein SAMN05192539_103166 [Paraburkholderia diazotrophica]
MGRRSQVSNAWFLHTFVCSGLLNASRFLRSGRNPGRESQRNAGWIPSICKMAVWIATVPSGAAWLVRRTSKIALMKNFFDSGLAQRYGYGIAVYIAARTADLQRGIDATNAQRRAAGRRLLEDARVEEIICSMRNKGELPAEPGAGGASLSNADATG